MENAAAFPGADRPDRSYRVDANGVGIMVHEWGDADGPPLFLLHGGFDFAGTFDVFAPKLSVGGWRVVSWDQRGHGDSDHAALYSWEADVRDASPSSAERDDDRAPLPIVGHSKGGGLMPPGRQLVPGAFLPPRQPRRDAVGIPMPDVAEHERSGWSARR